MKVLSEFSVGDTGRVEKILGAGAARRRLLDMGLTPGVVVTLTQKAPLGDPLEIALRGYALTVRKSEAELVVIRC